MTVQCFAALTQGTSSTKSTTDKCYWLRLISTPPHHPHQISEFIYIRSACDLLMLKLFSFHVASGHGFIIIRMDIKSCNCNSAILWVTRVCCLCCPGALLVDQFQGFWLTHSIPHFPPFPEMGFGYPSTGKLYGQSIQCTTYSYKHFHKICKHTYQVMHLAMNSATLAI